jgi:hypothetical protein
MLYWWGTKATSGDVLQRIVAEDQAKFQGTDKDGSQPGPASAAPARFQFLDLTVSESCSVCE